MRADNLKELDEFRESLQKEFPSLRKTITRNLTCLIFALILLLRTHRGWYGRLTLSGISRCFPSEGKAKSRYKRLCRFLDNEGFQMMMLTRDLIRLIHKEGNLLPVIVDQSAIGDVQVISANVPDEGRSIPIAIYTFQYGQIKKSQNLIEEEFLTKLSSCLPEGIRIVRIMDRGYTKARLIKNRLQRKELFILRARRDVTCTYRENGKTYRKGIGRLRHRLGKPRRYRDCLYQGNEKIKVDIVVYREKTFKEPWFLMVPSGMEDTLPTELVVTFYRRRMRIEVTFRDFKSHLGLRGLSLKVRKGKRLDRLLAAMALVYILLLVLGKGKIGKFLRKIIEVPRSKARHGTKRSLSCLTVSLFAISDTFLLTRDNLVSTLTECFNLLQRKEVFSFIGL